MISQLTGGQRLWLLFVVVLLASTLALIAVVWPKREPGLVADLRSPACAAWRGMPVESVPDVYPEPGQQCYSIRSFLFHQHVSLASEDDYDSYLNREGVKIAFRLLVVWAALAVGGYALAWSSARTVKALQKPRSPGSG